MRVQAATKITRKHMKTTTKQIQILYYKTIITKNSFIFSIKTNSPKNVFSCYEHNDIINI